MKSPTLVVCVTCLIWAHARAQTDGTVDASFVIGSGAGGPAYNLVRAMEVDDQSRILLAGSFNAFNGIPSAGIVRLLPSGTNDVSFNPGTGFTRAGSLATVYATLRLAQGDILVGGLFDSFNGKPATNLVMLTDSGALNTNFLPQVTADESVYVLANQPGKGILIGGASASSGLGVIKRLTTTGSIDPSFQVGGVTGVVFALGIQTNGSILVGGSIQSVAGTPVNGLARLTPDGGFDPSFNAVLTSSSSSVAEIRTITLVDQELLVGGTFNGLVGPVAPLLRALNTDGSEQTRFEEGAFTWDTEIRAIAVLPDFRIIAAGAADGDVLTGKPVARPLVRRFSRDGKADPSFSASVLEQVDLPAASALKLDTNGRVLVAGDFYHVNSLPYTGVCRLVNTAPPLLFNNSDEAGYFQFCMMSLSGASYVIEECNAAGLSWRPVTYFIGGGTVELHRVQMGATGGIFRVRQQLNN